MELPSLPRDEVSERRALEKIVRERHRYHIEDKWLPDMAVSKTAAELGIKESEVRRILEKKSRRVA